MLIALLLAVPVMFALAASAEIALSTGSRRTDGALWEICRTMSTIGYIVIGSILLLGAAPVVIVIRKWARWQDAYDDIMHRGRERND